MASAYCHDWSYSNARDGDARGEALLDHIGEPTVSTITLIITQRMKSDIFVDRSSKLVLSAIAIIVDCTGWDCMNVKR